MDFEEEEVEVPRRFREKPEPPRHRKNRLDPYDRNIRKLKWYDLIEEDEEGESD